MELYIVLLLHVFVSIITTILGSPTQCDKVLPNEGAEVQVTCKFSRSLSGLPTYSVSVTYHPVDLSHSHYVLVLNRKEEEQRSVKEGLKDVTYNDTHVSFRVATALYNPNGSYSVNAMTTAGNTTTCVAPSVPKGQQGHVICNFNRNVSLLHSYTVVVEHYPIEEGRPEPVLLCSHIDTLQCLISDGYTFDFQIDNTLRLQVQKASTRHVGRYACDVLSPQINKTEVPQLCRLELEVLDASSSSISIPLVVGIAVAALLVGLVAGGFICGCYCSKRRSPENTDAARPMSTATDPFLEEEENTDAARPMSTTAVPLLEEEERL